MTDDHPREQTDDRRPGIDWRTSPIDRTGWLMMLTTFLASAGVLTIVGLAVVEWWDGSALGERDADLIRWFEDRRSASLTTFAELVSLASDTLTKVIVGVALIPVCLWLFRRWHEYALIVGGLLVEVSAFGLSARLVGRDRPPVEQLDGAPTDSFPSGHIAAATVFYVGLALVIFMRTRRPGPRAIAVLIAVVMPIGMVLSRLYLGMHYLSDAVAGLALGAVVLVVMWRVVHRTLPFEESPQLHDRAELDPDELVTS
ncbi:MAG: phosphatase PAP2 family protein [Ilumatobacteraceae bacterium]|nr:phosphatase PAP2 family protein [Ilumatobacteraceae bacterium]